MERFFHWWFAFCAVATSFGFCLAPSWWMLAAHIGSVASTFYFGMLSYE